MYETCEHVVKSWQWWKRSRPSCTDSHLTRRCDSLVRPTCACSTILREAPFWAIIYNYIQNCHSSNTASAPVTVKCVYKHSDNIYAISRDRYMSHLARTRANVWPKSVKTWRSHNYVQDPDGPKATRVMVEEVKDSRGVINKVERFFSVSEKRAGTKGIVVFKCISWKGRFWYLILLKEVFLMIKNCW